MPLSGEYAPSPSDFARKQVETYEASGGAEAVELMGRPVVILTSVGAKTGKLRKTPVMRVEHNGEYAVVGSLAGAPQNPGWVYNLRKDPHVELQDGREKHDYVAREIEGDERAVWWERAVEAAPDYVDFEKKTDRLIPVFVLTRTPG
ncbi:nitroreductase family deazaflavin-dependent oxidoreductase [Amycolatopsis sp. NPDC021455]|uniref:nitroreductase family deazaflavin-dependent oxidoreductase n=1 Tax=Amycolatopsis sp. NPDC021455 TaxID=3154901 RepID=UPI0033D671C1